MKALCFGEILWDFLPAGLFPGGAPFNVAYHLHQHGAPVQVLSAVGRDLLGDELLRRLAGWGLTTGGIGRLDNRPTGHVVAEVADSGDAHYTITPHVAWDEIPLTEAARAAVATTDVLVYGSLAQRSSANRALLDQLHQLLRPEAWRVFDVNLRAPHDDLELVSQLAQSCTLLKVNALEASRLAGDGLLEKPGAEQAQALQLSRLAPGATICITAGARGAGLLHHGQWSWADGQAVVVADTVGAGDAFLASLVTHLWQGRLSPADCLARACRLGEWVATQRGGTPRYPSAPLH